MPAEKAPKEHQNQDNLLILVISRFQRKIPVGWRAKKQGTEFGAIWSKGKCRTASSSSRPKNCQKLLQGAKQGQSANTGIFPFQMLDSGEMACISPRTRVWCNSV